MMRLFIGIGMPREARDALHQAVTGLGIQGQRTAPDNYHLTLAFLGEHDERLKPLEGVLREAGQTCAPFPLTVAGLSYFGRRNSALLHARLADSRALAALAGTVRALLSEAGETFDGKPFAAHITLARQAGLSAVDLHTQLPPIVFPAERLTLYHSARVQGILRYRPVFETLLTKEDVQA